MDEQELVLIRANGGTDDARLPNSGKTCFLQMIARAVMEVNAMHEKDGFSYARNAMIVCVAMLNTKGRCLNLNHPCRISFANIVTLPEIPMTMHNLKSSISNAYTIYIIRN